MLQKLFNYSRLIILSLGFALLGLIQFTWFRHDFKPIQRLEGLLLDSRYLMRLSKPPHSDIQIVGIEASSLTLDTLSPDEVASSSALTLMQQPWPWDRHVHAEVLNKILESGARVVVVDLVFRGDNPGNPALAEVIQKYPGQIILASFFDSSQTEGDELQYVQPQSEIVGEKDVTISGYANIWADPDNVVRRSRYRTSLEREYGLPATEGSELRALSFLAAERFKGPLLLTSQQNENYIDYAGVAGTYPVVPVEYLFVENIWKNSKALANGATFKDKIVIIGPTAEVFKDVHQTPFGAMSGPEIQANLIATLLRNSGLREIDRKWAFCLEAAFILSGILICLQVHRAAPKAAMLFGTFFLYVMISGWLFEKHIVVPMAPALASFTLAGSSAMLLQFAAEQYERLRMRGLLDRYVSRNVAQTILQDQRSFVDSLQGQRKAVTVLFSDIRGFTTMTEGARAEELVSQLNEYFHEMVGIVLREGGTLQKFIGDAIMAVWGDTHTLGTAEDARRAVKTAVAMRAALQRLNDAWQARPERMKLAIGIGINHGEVVVGNIGHPQRMEFTVLGDAVNLASRLEGATKNFKQDMLIGESVFQLTRQDFTYRSVDYLVVKGKTKPIEVYTVPDDPRPGPLPWLARYHEALELYRHQEFSEASAIFREVIKSLGYDDSLCEIYQKRCEDYLLHPPPKDWNGVYLLKEK